ncbi:MAG: PLD nuclease N-terminal domain-containing protein [Actinomycetota bacterium]|jgi:hypothetical protein|nr:PLDc_N domain-containing protein [Acidothermales bacterium]MDQ3432091.1 PLD nuclease N-terminal domain-containing protein [Actinomycetota bacterium]
MLRFLPVLAAVVMTVYAAVDCLQSDAARVRLLPKYAWLAAILLVAVVGPIGWLLAGRPRPGAAPRPTRSVPPLAPDDDPGFQRWLAEGEAARERMRRRMEEEPPDSRG